MKSDLKLQTPKPFFERIRALPELRISRNLFLVLLLFWGFVLCSVYLEQITAWVITILLRQTGGDRSTDYDLELLMHTGLTVIPIALVFVCSRLIENRPCRTLFLTRRKCLPDYLCGLLLGFGMMTAVILIAWCSGAIRYEGLQTHMRPLMMILLPFGWLIQGFSEELICRGWLMTSVGTHYSTWLAVIINAICFALLHLGNDGISFFAIANLILFSAAESLYVLRTGSLWGAAALHSVWNWAQGNFFGMQVSGIPTGSSVFSFSQTEQAKWIGGGMFGLEGGAAATAVMLAVIVILLLIPARKYETEE